jgi:hypothetical protein
MDGRQLLKRLVTTWEEEASRNGGSSQAANASPETIDRSGGLRPTARMAESPLRPTQDMTFTFRMASAP